MDNFNHNIIEQLEAEVKNKHFHKELVLQGRMVGIRNGHSLNIQGPHDILMAEVQVVTPAGIHTLVLQDGNRHTGNLQRMGQGIHQTQQLPEKASGNVETGKKLGEKLRVTSGA